MHKCSRGLSIFDCLLKLFSIFGWSLTVLLFEIPYKLGGVAVANGFTDIFQLQIGCLKQFLCTVQLKRPNNSGE